MSQVTKLDPKSSHKPATLIPGAEPVVRVGVVLPGDGKSRIDFELPDESYAVSAGPGEPSQPLPASRQMSVEASGGRLMLQGQSFARSGFDTLRLTPAAPIARKRPGRGVVIRGVIAGRRFHWRQAMTQTLSDTLEFRAQGPHVVLINELPLEDYIVGVVTAEMSGACPLEYMKAQSVVARSWLLAAVPPAHPGQPFAVCNDDCCQRYQGTDGWTSAAEDAVVNSRGQVLVTASGDICRTCYSKNSGGITEDAETIWRKRLPGLRAQFDGPPIASETRFFPISESNVRNYIGGEWLETTHSYAGPNVISADAVSRYLGRVDDGASGFRWRVDVTQEELRSSVARLGTIADLDTVRDIAPGGRGRSGRLKEIVLTYATKTGSLAKRPIGPDQEIRTALRDDFLRSSAIVVDLKKDKKGVIEVATFHGAGWGHGVGLCQIGGLGRAQLGQSYKQILGAYYDQTRLIQIYP